MWHIVTLEITNNWIFCWYISCSQLSTVISRVCAHMYTKRGLHVQQHRKSNQIEIGTSFDTGRYLGEYLLLESDLFRDNWNFISRILLSWIVSCWCCCFVLLKLLFSILLHIQLLGVDWCLIVVISDYPTNFLWITLAE